MIGAMAIIIVVSVQNGFTQLIGKFYSDFDPDLKITSVEGKMFDPDSIDYNSLKDIPGVVSYANIIEEVAMLKYGKQQYFATVKGVPDNYIQYTNLDKHLIDGEYYLKKDGINYAVMGLGVASSLGAGVSFLEPVHIYFPKKGNKALRNPARAFNTDYIFPSAVFSILEEIDDKYIIVSNTYAAELFESGSLISSIEIALDETASIKKTQKEIEQVLGEKFHVKNKEQQRDLVFKTMKSEKFWVFVILVFILVLASGNMIGNLAMLYIDKKEDVSILRSMGLSLTDIHRIFLYEGWLISFLGGFIGTLMGVLICWLQITFELVKLPGGTNSFIIAAFPVRIIFTDIIFAFLAILVIGFFASWYPVKFMTQEELTETNIN